MDEKNLNDLEKRVENYQDADGLSSKKLNFGLWFVEKTDLFKKIIIAILIAISSLTWAYSIYGFAYYLIKGIDEDEKIARNIVSTTTIGHEFIVNKSPEDLAISKVNSFNSNGLYDFYIEIENKDKNFMAWYDYCFVGDALEIECGKSYIYPGQRKYIMALGKDIGFNPINLKFFISNLRWERINLHKIFNWDDFYFERTNITTKNISFSSAYLSGLSEKLDLNILKFTAKNKTPFNYWGVNFNILLYRDDSIVAINRYMQSEFMSEKEIDIDISWPGSLGKISSIEIIPEVDIMNDSAYIKYEGGEGEIK